MTAPRLHHTPPEAVKERVRETVHVAGRTFRLDRPGNSDLMFDHPAVRAAYAKDEYIPYWAELWPAARMLAKAVLAEPWDTYPEPREAVEVACGLGLAGIAALSRGLRVTFTDIDGLAVEYAAANARLNGFTDFRTGTLDVRSPPSGLQAGILLGSDLLYEPRLVEPVVQFLDAVLAPDGVALIADPDRISSRPFRHHLREAGLHAEVAFARAGSPGGDRVKGSVYRITRGG
jgi:predicted nicotinamide N-methyase